MREYLSATADWKQRELDRKVQEHDAMMKHRQMIEESKPHGLTVEPHPADVQFPKPF